MTESPRSERMSKSKEGQTIRVGREVQARDQPFFLREVILVRILLLHDDVVFARNLPFLFDLHEDLMAFSNWAKALIWQKL